MRFSVVSPIIFLCRLIVVSSRFFLLATPRDLPARPPDYLEVLAWQGKFSVRGYYEYLASQIAAGAIDPWSCVIEKVWGVKFHGHQGIVAMLRRGDSTFYMLLDTGLHRRRQADAATSAPPSVPPDTPANIPATSSLSTNCLEIEFRYKYPRDWLRNGKVYRKRLALTFGTQEVNLLLMMIIAHSVSLEIAAYPLYHPNCYLFKALFERTLKRFLDDDGVQELKRSTAAGTWNGLTVIAEERITPFLDRVYNRVLGIVDDYKKKVDEVRNRNSKEKRCIVEAKRFIVKSKRRILEDKYRTVQHKCYIVEAKRCMMETERRVQELEAALAKVQAEGGLQGTEN
ncbi:hypothetical protein H2248_003403 [Termitomyces sp. 'cryptogamus']|nr:hypothetical protein H2248_003403 [Termitomyces sp. 'cryptogamus']